MRKTVAWLLVIFCSLAALAQQSALVVQQSYSAAGTSAGLPVAGYTNFTLTFSPATNTATTGCLVQVDSGPTAAGPWTSGGLITSTACNKAAGSGGTVTVTSEAASYAQINVTQITGGTIKVTFSAVNGALSKASGGGGTPGGSTDAVQYNAGSGSFGGISDFTTNGTTAVTVASGGTLTIASGGTLTCASGSTCPSGGGGDTITSPNSTMTIGGTSTNTTIDVNLGNANTWTNQTFVAPALGTPASGVITNLTGTCTGCTANAATSAAALSISGQTGLMSVTGLTSTNRIKTVRDAADTILELGGSYTPTGTWTSLTIAGGALSGTFTGAPTLSGNVAFTGTPMFSNALALGSSTATTQASSDNSTKLATTAYVTTAVANLGQTVYLASSMTPQTTVTPTAITGMAWNIAANTNYSLSCNIGLTLATTATVQFDLNGPGSPISYSLQVQGGLGAAAAWNYKNTMGASSWGTATGASGASADTTYINVAAGIQNGSTASGTQLQLRTIANGSNALTVLKDSFCSLTLN